MSLRFRTNGKLLDHLSMAAFLAYVVLIAGYAWLKPHYNWDMVAYRGASRQNLPKRGGGRPTEAL
jgi:hypothetical protein